MSGMPTSGGTGGRKAPIEPGTVFYIYEDIAKKWLGFLIWKRVPKPLANSFLKPAYLVSGSPNASGNSLWSGPHSFYEGTMAINGIRALYFSHEAVAALVDIIVAKHPDLDAGLLLPNPDKRIASSSFSAIEPRMFKSTEELQAGRQGMKLTHNVSLLAQNKLKFAQFERDGKGAVLAIDIESYEHNHDKLTEIGYAFISWRKQEGGGPIKEIRSCEHLIVEENMRYRNRQYTGDNRDNFIFGRSKVLRLRKAIEHIQSLITHLSTDSPLLLVFHNASAEIEYFSTLGISTQTWQHGFPSVDKDAELEQALDVALQDGGIYIMDTQKLYAASGREGARAQIGLEKALIAMGMPGRYLHNAGNDSCYTLAIYEELVGHGSMRAELIAQEGKRQQEARQRRANNHTGWE